MALLTCLLLLNYGMAASDPQRTSADVTVVSYMPSAENILNPERGFHKNTELIHAKDLKWVREQGCTLVRAYVRLDAYRDRPLPPEFLRELRDGFAAVRAAGIKVLPIFAYNFPTDADIQHGSLKDIPDAPLAMVFTHLRQLKPVWTENQDVIACLELGFVGAWGEWHSSKNNLDTPENKKAVLEAILRALPNSRMMQIRYPADLIRLYPVPLNDKQAFTGSNQARTAWANMCFLSNESDSGTYLPLETKAEKQKYLEQMTRFVVVGGETCQITPEKSRADCATAEEELRRFHWSYLNLDFYQPTIERWRRDGCLPTIDRRLGYRLVLREAAISRHARPGGPLPVRLTIANEGWAAPFNPRRMELALRSTGSGRLYRLPVKADPRRWFGDTQTHDVNATVNVPADAQPGGYEVLLGLPDPLPSLTARPEYAIRLANQDLWEPQTGLNRLNATVTIEN